MKKVLLIFGGKSGEYEVALKSAAFVYQSLIEAGEYEIILCGIEKNGKWHYYTGDAAAIPDNSWLEDSADLYDIDWVMDNRKNAFKAYKKGSEADIKEIDFDIAFPVLHGDNGEDGTIQGLFQILEIPYVGCDTAASAVSMDKAISKCNAEWAGIPVLPWVEIRERDYAVNPEEFLKRAEEVCAYPMFVKPANGGSSLGASKIYKAEDFDAAVKEALKYDKKVLAEKSAEGREIELAVCQVPDSGELIVSKPGEIIVHADFYDYNTKYIDDNSELKIPADLPEDIIEKFRVTAAKVFRINRCTGLSRVDFFYIDGDIVFNEINTMPGFTSISMYPKMMAEEGYEASELMRLLLKTAEQRRFPYQSK